MALALHFVLARRSAPITPGSMGRSLVPAASGLMVLSLVLGGVSLLRARLASPVLMVVVLLVVGLGTYLVYLRRVLHLTPGSLLPRREPS